MNNNANKLGKGLSSLLGEKKLNLNSGLMSIDLTADKIQVISIELLSPNRFQPRKFFNDEELKELSISIKEFGILQPIIVRKLAEDLGKFEIIAGERRFRASKLAGLDTVPVIVKDFDDKDVLSLAIIENIQRSDLSVMEEAEAYDRLMKEFNYTQQDVAEFVGKSRSHIANIIRLLDLPIEIKELLYQKKIDMGHARALINCDRAIEIANTIIDANLSVRETEKLVRDYNQEKINLQRKVKKAQISMINKEYFTKVETSLFNKIHLKSKIDFDNQKKKGKIIINYSSLEQLEDFLKKIKND
ncbi:MAG TPA: ParB/RepB/Spo0J family partition protein [Rickettsiales bacterium]|nr:ParB/RepB/Spo0J family partition protein [Rickettsiales bacterium]